jgi:hypothetical protein
MNEEELRSVIRAVIEAIEEIMAENNRTRKALVAFTGGMINFDEALDSLIRLKAAGIEMRYLSSPAADIIHDQDRIAGLGIPKAEDFGLAKNYDALVIPLLTVNTAAKAAHAISDTKITNLIRGFLQVGKPVVAARDAADPDCPAKRNLYPNMTSGLADTFRENLCRLEMIGVTLTPARDLCTATQQALKMAAESDCCQTCVPAGSTINCPDRFLTANTIQQLAAGSVIRMTDPRAIVTSMAADLAATRGIRIERG